MADTEKILTFLMSIPPEKLSHYCSASEKMTELCARDDFIKEYSQKYNTEIKRRKRLRVSGKTFVPSARTSVYAPSPKKYNFLPDEKAPDGYIVVKKWHWAFETWAYYLPPLEGRNRGEIPHFNIRNVKGGPILHVYLSNEKENTSFMVVDELGEVLFRY